MLWMKTNIKLPESSSYTIDKVNEVTLVSSRFDLSDTLVIKLPNYKGYDRNNFISGSLIVWNAGYDEYGMVEEFRGYITDVTQKYPLEIIAKDKMYWLQNININKYFNATPLSGFIKTIIPSGIPTEIQSKISGMRITMAINNKSIRWALRELSKFGIDSFFREGKLILQNPVNIEEDSKIKTFRIGYNIIEDKLLSRTEKKMKVVLKSYDPEAGVINSSSYGDKDKNALEKVFTIDGITSKDLSKRAEDIYMEIAGPGMRGSFITFGTPSVNHSDIIRIEDLDNPERTKSVFVERVVKNFNSSEAKYRQEIFPGIINFNKDKTKPVPKKILSSISK